jgi:hypothetical protein
LRSKNKEAGSNSSQEEIKAKVALDAISKSKAKGISPDMYIAQAEAEDYQNPWKITMGEIYRCGTFSLEQMPPELIPRVHLQRLRAGSTVFKYPRL